MEPLTHFIPIDQIMQISPRSRSVLVAVAITLFSVVGTVQLYGFAECLFEPQMPYQQCTGFWIVHCPVSTFCTPIENGSMQCTKLHPSVAECEGYEPVPGGVCFTCANRRTYDIYKIGYWYSANCTPLGDPDFEDTFYYCGCTNG